MDKRYKRKKNETEQERIRKERFQYIDELESAGLSKTEIVEILIKKYEIKQAQAYRLIQRRHEEIDRISLLNLYKETSQSITFRNALKKRAFLAGEFEIAHKIQIEKDKLLKIDQLAAMLVVQQNYVEMFMHRIIEVIKDCNRIHDPNERLNIIVQQIGEAAQKVFKEIDPRYRIDSEQEGEVTREISEGESDSLL